MKTWKIGIALLFLFAVVRPTIAASGKNLLAESSGASIVSASSEYSENWSAKKLLDQTTATGWCSVAGKPFPHILVIKLPHLSRISEFVVDNTGTQEDGYPGISARRFELFASTSSSDDDYELVLRGEAAKGARESFSLSSPAEAKWLKLVIKSNWGNEEYTEIMELEAYGEQRHTGGGGGSGHSNLLDGASVVSASSEYNDNWNAAKLIDHTTATGWCSIAGKPFPHTLVFKMQHLSRISKFVVDNTGTQEGGYPGISARRFELYVSTTSEDEDYNLVLSGEAAKGARETFSVDPSAPVLWIKLVVLSNWGNEQYTEIMELEAYGELYYMR